MTTSAPTDMWFLQLPRGEIYGPVSLFTLAEWASQNRVAPDHLVSSDRQNWVKAATLEALGMEWLVENSDGATFGPFHPTALLELVRVGRVGLTSRATNRRTRETMPAGQFVIGALLQAAREAAEREAQLDEESRQARERGAELERKCADDARRLKEEKDRALALEIKLHQVARESEAKHRHAPAPAPGVSEAEFQRLQGELDAERKRFEEESGRLRREAEHLREDLEGRARRQQEEAAALEAAQKAALEAASELARLRSAERAWQAERRELERAAAPAAQATGGPQAADADRTKEALAAARMAAEAARAEADKTKQDLAIEHELRAGLDVQRRETESALRRELEALHRQIAGLGRELDVAREELAEARQRSGKGEELTRQLAAFKGELEAARLQADEARQRLDLEQARQARSAQEAEEARSLLQAERTRSEAEARAAAGREAGLQSRVAQLSLEIESLMGELAESRSREEAYQGKSLFIEQKARERDAQRDREAADLRARIDGAVAERDTAAGELQREKVRNEETRQTLRKAEERLVALTEEDGALSSRLVQATGELEQERRAHADLRRRAAEAERELGGRLEKSRKKEEQAGAAQAKALADLQESREALRVLQTEAAQKERQLTRQLKDMEKAYSAAAANLERAEQKLSGRGSRAMDQLIWLQGTPEPQPEAGAAPEPEAALRQRVAAREAELRDAAARIVLLERDLDAIRSDLQNAQKSAEAERSNRQEELERARKEAEDLESVAARAVQEVESKEAQLRDLRKRCGPAVDAARPAGRAAREGEPEVVEWGNPSRGAEPGGAGGEREPEAPPKARSQGGSMLTDLEARAQAELLAWQENHGEDPSPLTKMKSWLRRK